jgi:leucine dehydrogenase
MFSHPDADGHELVQFVHDPTCGLRAIIALHSTVRGPAFGGCRMWPYASEADALSDALRLSRGMTCKAAIMELPYGGGKTVVIGDPARDKTPALLLALAAAIAQHVLLLGLARGPARAVQRRHDLLPPRPRAQGPDRPR